MKKIKYSITFLGFVEVPDNYTDEQIEDAISLDCLSYDCNIGMANDIEWEEE